MKHLKMLAMATVAAAAVTAFFGSTVASATVLCSTTSTPCTGKYGAGTKFVASLEDSAVLETTSSQTQKTCTDGKITGTVSNAGSATETVKIGIDEWTWSNCTQSSVTLVPGELEVHHINGTDNGTLTAKNSTWTTTMLGVSCSYGLTDWTHIGTLTGGTAPTIDIDAVVIKHAGSFICPSHHRLTATFKITEPTPLYVEAS